MRFSISRLLAIMALTAVVLAAWPRFGHFVVYATALILFVYSAYLCRSACSRVGRLGRVALLLVVGFLFFTLSIGPASWYVSYCDNSDRRDPTAREIYYYWFSSTAFRVQQSPAIVREAASWYIGKGLRPRSEMKIYPGYFGWEDQSVSDPNRGVSYGLGW